MKIQSFVVSPFASNCYVLSLDGQEGRAAVIIDPGDTELGDVFRYVEEQGLDVQAIWNTHAHLDHVMGVDLVRARYGVQALVHGDDLPLWDGIAESARRWLGKEVPSLGSPDGLWTDGDEVCLGTHKFRIWHTPGHSPGSVCLVGDEMAFTGDTLFAGTIGRTDLPLSNPNAMRTSLSKLLALPDELQLFPGHMSPTSMEHERHTNPFLRSATVNLD